MNKFDIDDKDLAMFCIALLAAMSLFVIEDPTATIGLAIAAIAALATGRNKVDKP